MKKNLVVGFLTASNPKDKKAWSGSLYRMCKSLDNEFETIIILDPIIKPKWLKLSLLFLDVFHRTLFGGRFNKTHNTLSSRYYGYKFQQQLKNVAIDVIYAPSASVEIANLKTNIPICLFADTSFEQIRDYYSSSSKFSKKSIKISNQIEQLAISKSTTQVYPSQWASQYVIDFYGAKKENVFTAKLGANIDKGPSKEEILKNYNETIKLLFIGVDWKRKGGNIALETLIVLLEKGHNVSLTICGCIPPVSHSKMNVIPFLNKEIEAEYETFKKLLCDSHLLILPTRAECYGVVFCEANAYGIPAITTSTGGITSIIQNGVNGYALPLEATAEDYALKIEPLLSDIEKLKNLSITAREVYDKELNWNIWVKKMNEILTFTHNQKQLH
ncbi:MAG: glycosyltransferase family 4 protein [Vicingaceae bacterium]